MRVYISVTNYKTTYQRRNRVQISSEVMYVLWIKYNKLWLSHTLHHVGFYCDSDSIMESVLAMGPTNMIYHTDSKVHGANVGHTWGPQGPGGRNVGHMNSAIWTVTSITKSWASKQYISFCKIWLANYDREQLTQTYRRSKIHILHSHLIRIHKVILFIKGNIVRD